MMTKHRICSGTPHPQGATWDGAGVNFSLFSAHATKVELCLFDATGRHEVERIELPEFTDEIWHGYVEDLGPGTVYGYRVHGPYRAGSRPPLQPAQTAARSVRAGARSDRSNGTMPAFGYTVGADEGDLSFDTRDSAPFVPKCGRRRPGLRPARRSRPAHACRGTRRSSTSCTSAATRSSDRDLPSAQRGTFAGLGSPQVIDYIKSLGVTSVELMPVHLFVNDRHLLERGLTNYWGYNSIGFFAPEPRYHGRSRRRPARVPGDGRALPRRRASKSSSTSSTTTPPKATSWGRRCRSRASTTRPTTGWCPTTRATTTTTPAPATRSTCGIRASRR